MFMWGAGALSIGLISRFTEKPRHECRGRRVDQARLRRAETPVAPDGARRMAGFSTLPCPGIHAGALQAPGARKMRPMLSRSRGEARRGALRGIGAVVLSRGRARVGAHARQCVIENRDR